VCVCKREREREREKSGEYNKAPMWKDLVVRVDKENVCVCA